MAAPAHTFFSFSFSVQPQLLRSAGSPLARTTGNGGRRRGSFRPLPVKRPGHEPASSISNDFDFQEGVASVRALLHHQRRCQKSSREMMTTVDHLKRLCIDHYFQDEIDSTIKSCMDLIQSDYLLDATLAFRLMREAGHHVSADEVLGRFTDDNNDGDFSLCHSKNISELLSLQDTSHLNMGSEASLYKAKEFSSRHLRSAINYMQQDPNLARYVRHSLDHPYHMSLVQYKAMHHLSYLQRLPTCTRNNTAIMEEIALAEFHLNKLLHQTEIQEIKRWWINLGLAQEIPAARDQVMKWYMWSMTVLQGHSLSRYRIEITKLISFVYIVDDIFDVVATQEELFFFTEAVKRWDLAAGDSLPGYMKSCYNALYAVTNDIADMAEKEHGMNPIQHLKKAWAMLFDGFMVEAKWLSNNQKVPASEDYLRNAVITSGVPLVFLHIFFMLGGHNVAKLTDIDPVISCLAKILRLWDDMGTAKDEAQEGVDGSYKELYLEENPHCSWRAAEEHMVGMIAGEWEELNRVCFSSNSFSPNFVRALLNFARMVGVMYSYDQQQRLPVLEDYTRMLLF